ncbi:MAG TPA: ABC transporter ATP-binding protein [Burkholderiales bacterium]|nr:ABC transporter ATP-binding protein [Burkholderiales bacterium]
MRKIAVEARNIAVSYDGGKTRVLHDINLDIHPGEFFALLGPSGSGKSTLLRLIAGFVPAQGGELLVGGEDVSRVPAHLRYIGMVFQSYALWPHMTVAQNVAFGLVERKVARHIIDKKVEAMLDLVGLSGYGNRRPNQLSGGQQQRVALARTLVIEPRVLLLDEPLSNLDAKLRVQMRQELKRLQNTLGITTIFVTHDQEEALTTCDRIAVMDGGVIQQVGAPEELYSRPVNRFVANFVGSINLLPANVLASDASGSEVECALFGRFRLADQLAVSAGEIAVRPLAMHLAPPGTPARPDDIVISARIESREFMGEFVRYELKAGDRPLTVDQSHRTHTALFESGSEVRVAVSPAEFRFLAD